MHNFGKETICVIDVGLFDEHYAVKRLQSSLNNLSAVCWTVTIER